MNELRVKRKPVIAYILQDFHIGGMESLIYRTAKYLQPHYDFIFIATHVPDILPKFHEIGTALYLGQDWLALSRYLRMQRVDIVQYGNIRFYADAALAAGVPVVIERTDGIRGGAALRPKAGLDAVIASTRGTIPPISKLIPSEKIHLIYNGIDLDAFDAVEPDRLGFGLDDILIGRVSRFSPGKNLGLLIDAVRQLQPHYPHIRLVLVGDNSKMPGVRDEMAFLREKARGLEEHVIFTGYVEHPAALIKGFDIGTCVSRAGNEGIPNSLIECMAARKPVVATRVDDIPELVEHEQNGLLTDDNDLAQLVNALERLINDPALCKQMGQAGRRRIEEGFNLKSQAEDYHQLYQQLLRTRPTALAIFWRRIRFTTRLLFMLWWERLVPEGIKALLRRVQGKWIMLRG